MKNIILITIISILITGCAIAPPAKPITSVNITLPNTNKWTQITNQSDGNQYLREWVPMGSTGLNAKWLIVEQKFILGSNVSAEDYIKRIFSLARKACTDVLYNGPFELNVSGYETSVGRFMCAQQKGKNYGTFTDQRIVTQGNDAYVVTSELRLPSSIKAGVLSFQKDQLNEMQSFMKYQVASTKFVRNAVTICSNGMPNC